MSTELDPRIHAFDGAARTADIALRGLVGDDWTFVTPHAAQAGNARVSLRAAPDADSAQVTEALPGEPVEVLWNGPAGWQRVRTAHDGYLGWARSETLTARTSPELTVSALRAHAYAGPKVSRPVRAELCRGSRLTRGRGDAVQDGHRSWLPVQLPDGAGAWVQEVILEPLVAADPAELALRLVDTPYVWGGRSAWGLDCSGLTQLVYAAAGRTLPRDADQQQGALPPASEPRRGDLAFFPGHVGVMLDAHRVVHANATHMRVTVETLGEGDYGRRLAADLSGFGRWPA